MKIYCCKCEKYVVVKKINGRQAYRHRSDLRHLNFWQCETCSNFVGCHKGTDKPLGNIPTKKIKKARVEIHALIDPIWKSGKMKRNDIYNYITEKIGWNYHTAKIRTIEEAREVYKICIELTERLNSD